MELWWALRAPHVGASQQRGRVSKHRRPLEAQH